ncbi:MAG: hypothetical protein HQK54_03275 [Oligoflexales bacterium]|nr:hypothetical protein [Oligoflexales bacterium]
MDYDVVERNKLDTPFWVKIGSGKISEQEDRLNYVFEKKGVKNLTLGIKQSEYESLFNACYTLQVYIFEKLMKSIPEGETKSKEFELVYQVLSEIIEKNVNINAKISDIYFESITEKEPSANEQKFFYRIFVFLTFEKKKTIEEILASVSDRLRSSSDEKMKKWSKWFEDLKKNRTLPSSI